MIPKIINYCWFGKNSLPTSVKKCINSWKKYCPDYKIIQWDETNFDVKSNMFVKEAYEAKAWAFVSDYARLKVIYENGGIYLDTDVELVKNLDFLLKNSAYIGIQQSEYLCNTGLGFGAEKGNRAIFEMLKEYEELSFIDNQRSKIVCPYLNDRAIQKIGKIQKNKVTVLPEITIFPPEYFDPYSVNVLFNKNTVSIHHYSGTWTSGSQRLKRKIAAILGTRNTVIVRNFIKSRIGHLIKK